ncbi:MAG: hypothetical protein V3U75_04370 [Methylococcaceae bacterium]
MKKKLYWVTCLLMIVAASAKAGDIKPFTSDGCSLSPDGTILKRDLWLACCVAHDKAYWQGGTRKEKRTADLKFKQCLTNKTGNPVLSNTMYFAVRLGGSAFFPTWYRWGYGWGYGRGYKKLAPAEKKQSTEMLQQYGKSLK